MKDQTKYWIQLIVIIIIVIALLAIGGWAQSESYKQATIENCKQYEQYPEKYIDKVPDGCVPQWFEANK